MNGEKSSGVPAAAGFSLAAASARQKLPDLVKICSGVHGRRS
jgi:hypothetical protein